MSSEHKIGVIDTHNYDSPDGEDALVKVIHTTKATAFLGSIGAAIDLLLYTKPAGIPASIGVIGNWLGPAAAAGAVFAGTTNITAQLRGGKDGPLNHAVGGCASGLALGAKAGSFKVATPACIGLALMMSGAKMMRDEGLPINAVGLDTKKERGSLQHYKSSFGAQPRSEYKPPENY